MTERHRSASRVSVRHALTVLLVLVLAGLLFAANARLAGGVDAREPQDLAHLVRAEVDRTDVLATEVNDLAAQVERLTDAQSLGMSPEDVAAAEELRIAAGRVAVRGPGLVVRLTDAAPNAPRPDWVTNDDLVVHQQDLEAVINALWAGGAEAMSLQDQRVVSTTAFLCVGNVLRLHDNVYSPPYEVRAIGDSEKMRTALLASTAVQNYLEWVDAIGLGWSVQVEEELELPAFGTSLDLKYASVPDGVAVLPSGLTP